jgi:hypothetical protein
VPTAGVLFLFEQQITLRDEYPSNLVSEKSILGSRTFVAAYLYHRSEPVEYPYATGCIRVSEKTTLLGD